MIRIVWTTPALTELDEIAERPIHFRTSTENT